MASFLSFTCAILCIVVTLDVGIAARNLRDERNLGGLPPLPDLPLPNLFELVKKLTSGGSAAPNARNLGGLPGLPKLPELPKLPKLPEWPPEFPDLEDLPIPKPDLPKLPKPELPFDLPFPLPEPFDLKAFLSNIFARKMDYEDLVAMRTLSRAQIAKLQKAQSPAPSPVENEQPETSPSTNQQTPSTNLGLQQPVSQGIMPSGIPDLQKPQISNPMPNTQSNMLGQPMNQGMSNPMQTHDMPNRPLSTPGQLMKPVVAPPPREGNERPDPRRRRLY